MDGVNYKQFLRLSMTQKQSRETEWQGFQQFHDPQHKHSELPQLKGPQIVRPHNLYTVSPQKNPRRRSSKTKKSEVRIEIPLSLSPAQDKTIKLSSNSAKQDPPAPIRQSRRYERIPIIRYQQDCRYAGKVIYKNFIPRTSDNYLRLLKQVDWLCGSEKKRDIRNLHGIQFSSQFQSGNLNLAIEYDLYMRVDSNTSGHRQWFFFSMRNERRSRVTLHVYRFKKIYSLFQRGMKPYARSRKDGNDWHPAGDSVTYHYQRPKNEYGGKKEKRSFVLTFHYTFEHENDEVFIAAGIPYSYTFLQRQLSQYRSQAQMRENVNFDLGILCKSMCGLDIPLVTIQHRMGKLLNSQRQKRFIIINTRTHSGETSSSWVLDGLLMEVAECRELEEWLLAENIVLKIVPMLNPDGVFIGNYRTGIVGDDFNRRFHSGRRQFYPEIFGLKKLVAQCKKEGSVQLFLDLHGHSILKNSFIYGPAEDYSSKFRLGSLPYHLLHNSKYFRLASCKFRTEKDNVQTARVFFQLKEDILSFTCENSLGLYYSQCQNFQMLHSDWQAFGQTLLRSMIDSFSNKQPLNKDSLRAPPSPQKQLIKTTLNRQTEKSQKKTIRAYNIGKTILRLPTANKSIAPAEQIDPMDSNYSFSQQICRQDQFLQPKPHSFHEKSAASREQGRLNMRRKSQAMKTPPNSMVQRIVGKKRLQQRKSSAQEQCMKGLYLIRSSTYDASEALKREIDLTNQQDTETDQQYEMEVINQNFSDQYVSMNDSDSEDENLPQQEKNYLFEYIKANQYKAADEDEIEYHPSEKQQVEKKTASGQQKISRFREIRFKSIEEMYECEAVTQAFRTAAKKPKLQPHKFKNSTSKSLVYKYNQIVAQTQNQFDDPVLAFSQQKRLNQRNSLRRAQKDPFVLFARKDKHTE